MKSNQPFVSLIIPTHARPQALKCCLEAVSGIHYPRDCFELIVAADGRDDRLRGIISQFKKELDVILVTQERSGPAAARNHGRTVARGEFLAFTDDDCRPASDWLLQMAAALQRNPQAAVTGVTRNAFLKNPYSSISQHITDFVSLKGGTELQFATTNNLALPAHLFDQINGFDASFPLAAAEDRDFCRRWLESGLPIVRNPNALVVHYHALSPNTFLKQQFQYGRGAFLLWRKFNDTNSIDSSLSPLAFYLKLIFSVCRCRINYSKIILLALMFLAQGAVLSGFISENLRRKTIVGISGTEYKETMLRKENDA